MVDLIALQTSIQSCMTLYERLAQNVYTRVSLIQLSNKYLHIVFPAIFVEFVFHEKFT